MKTEEGKFCENHDRSSCKARVNVPLYDLTTNINVSPAKGKTKVFPPWEPWVVKFTCKIGSQGRNMKNPCHKVNANIALYNLTKNTNVLN